MLDKGNTMKKETLGFTIEDDNNNFTDEIERVKQNIAGGHITPRLASAMLEHFGRALFLTGVKIDYRSACIEINPNHEGDMIEYRSAHPADFAHLDAKHITSESADHSLEPKFSLPEKLIIGSFAIGIAYVLVASANFYFTHYFR